MRNHFNQKYDASIDTDYLVMKYQCEFDTNYNYYIEFPEFQGYFTEDFESKVKYNIENILDGMAITDTLFIKSNY